jgi:dTDP-4-amino-4,6-dideoxygalactose transaminase
VTDPVPFVDLVRMHEPLAERFRRAFDQVLASGRYHLGPQTRAFEREFAEHEGSAFGVGCASGSDALVLALRALDIGPGDAVVTVSNSFMATAESIRRTGADVLFAEPDSGTRCLDPIDLARILEEPDSANIRAIIPVHLYGHRADIDGIRTVLAAAERSDIHVIGDAAQAHGSPGVASDTVLTCYSFYPAKNLGTLGDSGMVLSQDEALAERIRGLRNHGRAGKHAVSELGYNSRFDEIHGAILRIKLEVLREWNGKRRFAADAYRTLLKDVPGLVLPADQPDHVYHLFVVEVDPGLRDAVVSGLKERGIGVGLHYPVATHQMSPYPSDRPLPITEHLVRSVISLPMFPGLTPLELERTANALREALHDAHGETP